MTTTPTQTGNRISTPADTNQIVLLENIHPAGADKLRAHDFLIDQHSRSHGRDELADILADATVVCIRSKTTIDADLLDLAPKLLAIGCFCIGTNQVDLAEARRRGIAVFNSPFSNTRSVAELTLAEIIALHRRMTDRSMKMHRGTWEKSAKYSHEIRGRTLGIVGYGHIGSQLSILAEAFGMRVIYHDIIPKLPLGNAAATTGLEHLLKESDVVTMHVPATEFTENMIGKRELGMMREGAFLINNSRGSVVDICALQQALQSGNLGGAAIDVYPSEPRSNTEDFQCDLRGLSNVILTPHIGGSTEEAQEMIAHDVAGKLIRYLTNGSTTSAVNVPEVDLPRIRPDQHRILHFHHNVPGVLSKMHTMLAELGVNINAEHLQSDAEVSYVMLDVDATHGEAVREGLQSIDETIRVRTLW